MNRFPVAGCLLIVTVFIINRIFVKIKLKSKKKRRSKRSKNQTFLLFIHSSRFEINNTFDDALKKIVFETATEACSEAIIIIDRRRSDRACTTWARAARGLATSAGLAVTRGTLTFKIDCPPTTSCIVLKQRRPVFSCTTRHRCSRCPIRRRRPHLHHLLQCRPCQRSVHRPLLHHQ